MKLSRTLAPVAIAALCLFGDRQAALGAGPGSVPSAGGNGTGASVTVAPASQAFSGACPGTVHFTGVITGQGGEPVTYQFVGTGYANGPENNVSLPDNGTLDVSEELKVDSARQGTFQRQILVDGATLSNVATFSVACATASPASSPGTPPSGGGGGKFSIRHVITTPAGPTIQRMVFGVPSPYNLKSTTNPTVCGQHGGFAGLFCIQAVPDRYLILIWDWSSNDRWPAIDGYRVYDTTGGGRVLNQTVTSEQQTLEFFKPGSYLGRCYAVTAFKGSSESNPSPSFCTAGAQLGLRTLNLALPFVESHQEDYLLGDRPYDDCQAKAAMCFGWFYQKETNFLGVVTNHYNVLHRVYMIWDRPTIQGLNVAKATLTVTAVGHLVAGPANYGPNLNCFGAVGAATGPWLGTNNWTGGNFNYSVPASIAGDTATFDVTSIVRDWGAGRTVNYGFVFKGKSEDLGSDAEGNTCETVLDRNATLVIDYY